MLKKNSSCAHKPDASLVVTLILVQWPHAPPPTHLTPNNTPPIPPCRCGTACAMCIPISYPLSAMHLSHWSTAEQQLNSWQCIFWPTHCQMHSAQDEDKGSWKKWLAEHLGPTHSLARIIWAFWKNCKTHHPKICIRLMQQCWYWCWNDTHILV